MLAAQPTGFRKVALRMDVHPLALDGLDHERCDVTERELGLERRQVVELDHAAARQERCETGAEALAAVQRHRTARQAVERLAGVEQTRATGRALGELDRGLDALGARVGEEHVVQATTDAGLEFAREHGGQRRNLELHHRRQLERQGILQRPDNRRVIPAKVADGVSSEEVKVPIALGIPEVGTLGPHVLPVEADRAQDGREPGVHVFGELAGALAPFPGEQCLQVKLHPRQASTRPASNGIQRRPNVPPGSMPYAAGMARPITSRRAAARRT